MSNAADQHRSARLRNGLKTGVSGRSQVNDARGLASYSKNPSSRAASLLGGAKALGVQPNDLHDWIVLIREGIPFMALDCFGAHVHVTNTELAHLLGISTRTLPRRKRVGRLSQMESERLFRAARVIARAEDVFDDLNDALAWMRSPLIVLRGATPLSLLDTEVGSETIMRALGRIQHGIPV